MHLEHMIISASRRTDICAFHTEWFINRLNAGSVLVRNPVCRNVVTRVPLTRDVVDHTVFITKDPSPMLPHLHRIVEDYSVSFQITITPYGKDIEPNVPGIGDVIESLKDVSKIIGPDRTMWRFDPILFTEGKYSQDYVLDMFDDMCQQLKGHISGCTFSFLDYYRKLDDSLGDRGVVECDDRVHFVNRLSSVAKSHGIPLSSCCEDLSGMDPYVKDVACIDPVSMRSWNVPYAIPSTPVRKGCKCVKVVDIGDYDTCSHDCQYCYANSTSIRERSMKTYDPDSELLCGWPTDGDMVLDMAVSKQTKLF